MLTLSQMMKIKELHGQGKSQTAIAKDTGHHKKTVAKVLSGEHPGRYRACTRVRPSKLDPYKPALREQFEAYGLTGPRLHEYAVGMGYEGSYRTVRRFRTQLMAKRKAAAKLTVRYETPPGQQAQCDWFEPPEMTWSDGVRQKVYGFEIVLGHSRLAFTTYTEDMTLPTLLDCLARSFACFGGVPKEVLFDNMASVRLPGSKEVHPMMADFARHYGFTVKTHRVRRPRTKGKVEKFGGYAQEDFLNGRTFGGLVHLNAMNDAWLRKANHRVHATTRRKPQEHFDADEKAVLHPLAPPYTGLPVKRKVGAESTVQFAGNAYSVPPALCQQSVFVHAVAGRIQVLSGKLMVVADHAQAIGKGKRVMAREHLAEIWRQSVGRPHPDDAIAASGESAETPSAVAGPSPETTAPDVPQVEERPLDAYESFCDVPMKEAA